MTVSAQFELAPDSAHADGITSVVFSPSDPSLLLSSSWDKSVRLYDVHTNRLVNSYEHKGAVLDATFVTSTLACSGGLDRAVKIVDLNTKAETVIGTHENAVKSVVYSSDTGLIASGSWDSSLKVWDPRSTQLVTNQSLPAKVFSMDAVGEKIVVAMAGRHVHIYDVRNMGQALLERESSKFMTRVLRCMPNGQGYATGTIEGRIAVDYFDTSEETQVLKYAFKCHRQKIEGLDTVYPVNAIAYHPIHGTFVSGGGDSFVCIWDGFNRKRLKSFPKFPTSIASLSFSCDGSLLAIASSYTFEEGQRDSPNDAIFVRPIAESEVKPKEKN
ncbi:WD40-repeat-containing domain protein [Zopfochytrium polystomum]|nr:WD40-repeat-containing domain protein [Zopfochytrium polystomum]